MSHNILRVGENVLYDNSIVSYQLHTHQPYASTTLNNNDEIRIPIQTQDIYTLPSQSILYLEGKVLKDDNTASTNVHFVNNGLAHLFDEIRYELGGVIVDRVRNPGITSTIKGYCSFKESDNNTLQNAGWTFKENPPILDGSGNFNTCVPLKILMGVFEDHHKIILNVRQELVLIRSNSDLNALTEIEDKKENYKVILSKVLWKIPHVRVSDDQKLRLYKYLEGNRDLNISFRSWELHEYPQLQTTTNHTWAVKTSNQLETPRFIIIGFQTDRKNVQGKNMSRFDHVHLTNLKVYLNSEVFPYDNLNLDFDTNQYAMLYEMYAQFQKSYYYHDQSEPCFHPINFKKDAPLTVIDCSRQSEDVLKGGAVDIRIEFETKKAVPEKTIAYCLILHDRLVKYNPLTSTVRVV